MSTETVSGKMATIYLYCKSIQSVMIRSIPLGINYSETPVNEFLQTISTQLTQMYNCININLRSQYVMNTQQNNEICNKQIRLGTRKTHPIWWWGTDVMPMTYSISMHQCVNHDNKATDIMPFIKVYLSVCHWYFVYHVLHASMC